MDYEKLGYTVIKMKYGDVGKYNIKNNIFITDITPSLSAFQDVNVNTRGMGFLQYFMDRERRFLLQCRFKASLCERQNSYYVFSW